MLARMSDQVLRDLVAMGKFLGSLDGVGVKGGKPVKAAARGTGAAPAARALAPAPVRVAVSEARPAPQVQVASPVAPAAAVVANPSEADRVLASIREDIGDCKRCRLCEGRTNIVFGQGSATAELMFVGEAPGADEDASGLAFVGRAGQLLTDMIEKGMKMKRSDVFIANVIKCRPPGNRPPEADEVLTCQPFLEAQIKAIRPKAIVALGATAGKFMTKSAEPISKLRSRFGSWEGIPVMPTYHPAYLLRDPSKKKDVWSDLKLVMDVLGTRPE
jgi:uracil-DNA glycosylase